MSALPPAATLPATKGELDRFHAARRDWRPGGGFAMRISFLKLGPPCDLREKVIELLVLRAKVAELEKAAGTEAKRPLFAGKFRRRAGPSAGRPHVPRGGSGEGEAHT